MFNCSDILKKKKNLSSERDEFIICKVYAKGIIQNFYDPWSIVISCVSDIDPE